MRTLTNFGIASVVAILCIVFKDTLFITRSSWLPDLKSILLYLVVIDAFIYWIHRITHRVPYLRKLLHETHHDVFYLLPMDFLNVNTLEYLIYLVITNIVPLSFLSITLVEYFIVFTLIFTHSIYTHCETDLPFGIPLFIDSTYHRYHHQIGKGNYTTYLTIWDEFMKTRIPIPSIDPVRKREEEEKQKEIQEKSNDGNQQSKKENTN
jgi:sterol desaturase/sphingolipid hydroxylase (fatty acid hydroxylase superfamily)